MKNVKIQLPDPPKYHSMLPMPSRYQDPATLDVPYAAARASLEIVFLHHVSYSLNSVKKGDIGNDITGY